MKKHTGNENSGNKKNKPNKITYRKIEDLSGIPDKLQETRDFLNTQIAHVNQCISQTHNATLRHSMQHLLTDLNNTLQRLGEFANYNLTNYLAGRSEAVLLNDIDATIEATRLIFRKRFIDIVNAIDSVDVEPSIYDTIQKNKGKRDAFLQTFDNKIAVLSSPYKPYFSQSKATTSFKPTTTTGTASSYIVGKTVQEVGNDIKQDPSLSEMIQVGVFRYDGKWVSENNRGLATASISGIQPVRLSIIFTEQANLNYYLDKLHESSRCSTPFEKELFLSSLELERTQDNLPNASLNSAKKGLKNEIIHVPGSWSTISPLTVTDRSAVSPSDEDSSMNTLPKDLEPFFARVSSEDELVKTAGHGFFDVKQPISRQSNKKNNPDLGISSKKS